jgi:hypothetical protein
MASTSQAGAGRKEEQKVNPTADFLNETAGLRTMYI